MDDPRTDSPPAHSRRAPNRREDSRGAGNLQAEARNSSAFRWAIAAAIVLALAVAAWLVFGARGTVGPLLTPPQDTPSPQSGGQESGGQESGGGYGSGADADQPPAVTPNQDAGGSPQPTQQPAGEAGSTPAQ